jgi:ribosomal-protein-alanine N-acetyltransferase
MNILGPFPVLETQRLLLREIVAEDAPALFSIHGDAVLMQWFGFDPLPDVSAAENLVKVFAAWRNQPNPGTRWAIQLKHDPTLVGTCGLYGWNRNWRKCTIGYELAPHLHSQGYMHEALCAMLDWGFAKMRLNRVEAEIHPDNLASLKLARKLGFVDEGRLREAGRWNGQYHDLLQLSLLRREWRSFGD